MRLNHEMREQVITKALAAAFGASGVALDKEEGRLELAFWTEVFGPIKRHIAKMPDNWVDRTTQLSARTPGVRSRARWNVGGQCVEVRRLTTGLAYSISAGNYNYVGTVKEEALVDRCRAWQAGVEKWRKDKREAENTLIALLGNIGTFAKLEKEWPEGKMFYKSLPTDFPGSTGVPAVRINVLNHMLGLA